MDKPKCYKVRWHDGQKHRRKIFDNANDVYDFIGRTFDMNSAWQAEEWCRFAGFYETYEAEHFSIFCDSAY